MTKADRYPVPNIQDFTARLHGCSVFSKLDLRKGYYQVPVRAEDIPKTAVITPFGLWEFLRMPFGLKNAGQSFQRLMDRLMVGLDFVFVYLDDILIASPDQQTHLQHLRLVLERLREGGLLLNMDKCQFGPPAWISWATGCRPAATLVTRPGHHGGSSATGNNPAAEVFGYDNF